jgi:hypothetical protein
MAMVVNFLIFTASPPFFYDMVTDFTRIVKWNEKPLGERNPAVVKQPG